MNRLTDQQLLRDYAERRSEATFAERVRRHVDLNYSAARRMVCDLHRAERARGISEEFFWPSLLRNDHAQFNSSGRREFQFRYDLWQTTQDWPTFLKAPFVFTLSMGFCFSNARNSSAMRAVHPAEQRRFEKSSLRGAPPSALREAQPGDPGGDVRSENALPPLERTPGDGRASVRKNLLQSFRDRALSAPLWFGA